MRSKDVVVRVVAEYDVVVTVMEMVFGTTVDVATGPEHRQYPAFLSAVWMQLAGAWPFCGKQVPPRTVLVAIIVVGIVVMVVATANVDVAKDVDNVLVIVDVCS